MRKILQKIFTSLIFLLFYSIAFCQEPAFKNYTSSEGLASNNVYSSVQDDERFMWFATDNGVSRFDGTVFKNFTVADGLSDNSILRVAKDSKKRLWFLSFNGKLSFYKDGKIYNSSNSELLKKMKFTNAISNFFEDSRKNIWISCVDRTVVRVTPNDEVETIRNIESKILLEDNNGTIYSISSRGICLFKGIQFTYKEIGLPIRAAMPLPENGTILLATQNGIATYSINKNEYTFSKTDINSKVANIQGIFTDNKKNIWIASINGATEFENGILSTENEHNFFHNSSITYVFNDKNDNLWFSSVGSGVFMIPSLHVLSFDTKSGLVENNISSLALMGNDLVMAGTHNGSIQLIDHGIVKEKNQSIVNSAGSIIKIINSPDGEAWILTDQALLKYHNKNIITLSSSWNKSIFLSHDGTLWIGWGRGLRRVASSKVLDVFEDTIVNRFYAIEEINDDLFLGSDKGLYRYHDGRMIYEGLKDTLLRHRINSLAVTADSVLWIATNGYGLMSIDHGILTSYTVKDHLLSNHCNNILADGNKIYLCTDKGLNIIIKEKKETRIKPYSASNGLVSNGINQIIKKTRNTFLLATDHGIIQFNEKMLPETIEGVPYISDIIVNDVKLSPTLFYNFHYNENNTQIEFSSINFNAIGKTLYQYKLSGLDSGWNYTTSNSVKYSGLKPGNYKFIIAVQNINGEGGLKSALINFSIETPWWLTWWFRLVSVLVTVGTIALLILWRIRVYKKKIEQQKSMAESELKALRSQINPHFIYNSLNSIQDFIMQNQKEDANLYLAKFAKLMRNILTHSRTSKITLAEEIESLGLYLELESLRFNNQFTFKFEIDKQINPEEMSIPSMIIQPYVENSVLHGLSTKMESGRINICFIKSDGFLVCSIKDNGIGRKKALELKQQKMWKGSKSLGMKITQERIDLLSIQEKQKINLKIEDLKDEENNSLGTCVSIFFPVS